MSPGTPCMHGCMHDETCMVTHCWLLLLLYCTGWVVITMYSTASGSNRGGGEGEEPLAPLPAIPAPGPGALPPHCHMTIIMMMRMLRTSHQSGASLD